MVGYHEVHWYAFIRNKFSLRDVKTSDFATKVNMEPQRHIILTDLNPTKSCFYHPLPCFGKISAISLAFLTWQKETFIKLAHHSFKIDVSLWEVFSFSLDLWILEYLWKWAASKLISGYL